MEDKNEKVEENKTSTNTNSKKSDGVKTAIIITIVVVFSFFSLIYIFIIGPALEYFTNPCYPENYCYDDYDEDEKEDKTKLDEKEKVLEEAENWSYYNGEYDFQKEKEYDKYYYTYAAYYLYDSVKNEKATCDVSDKVLEVRKKLLMIREKNIIAMLIFIVLIMLKNMLIIYLKVIKFLRGM